MRLSILWIICALAVLAAMPARAQLMDSASPTFKVNNKRTGASPFATDIKTPSLKWKVKVGEGVESTPAIASDGTVHVGTNKDSFYAFNPDGSMKLVYGKCKY